MIPLFLASIVGWSIVLTRYAGPFDVLAALRASWRWGPLGCPVCTAAWVAGALAILSELAQLAPQLAPVLSFVLWVGAGPAAAELYDVTTDALRQRAYRDRAVADAANPETPEEPPT